MAMHMLSLTLNGLPSGLIWAWPRTPVGALQQMPRSQLTDTIPYHLGTVYPPTYPKYPTADLNVTQIKKTTDLC